MERVEISRCMVGLVHMQVCAINDATDEEILDVCNAENPSGTDNGWSTVCREDDKFWGDVGPVPCIEYKGRKHFMVAC